jgi:hypothetical protein
MLLFLLDIIVISVFVLSFAAIVFLYLNPTYNINIFKEKVVEKTCKKPVEEGEEGENSEESDNSDMEVYNISRNIYTYNDAENVCKELNGTVATKSQLKTAFDKGANWCNYGWTKEQLAMYPIQSNFYSKLQEDNNLKDKCGNIGLNGGYFKDSGLKFGVNCYGIKPTKDVNIDDNYTTILDMVIPSYENDVSGKLKRNSVLSFNLNNWSMHE